MKDKLLSIKKTYYQKKLFLLKYIFSIVVLVLAVSNTKNIGYSFLSFLELSFIFALSNFFIKKVRVITQVLNSLLILLFNIQLLILNFGSSYVTLTMIDNISSWEALGGRAFIYCLAIFLLIIFSLLPINEVPLFDISKFKRAKLSSHSIWKFQDIILAFLILMFEFISFLYLPPKMSPALSTYFLVKNKIEFEKIKHESITKTDKLTEKFAKNEVHDFIKKPSNLPEKPNVILIFTEGFSQHIIDDSRNITPTIKDYESKSISFKNYYNHTFATYRGIQSQLFSGYQIENNSRNYLISLPKLLSKKGYKTAFINTEPKNKEFSSYLSDLGFDKVYSSKLENGQKISYDKEAYEELFSKVERYSKNDSPFFISMYTFGTHVGSDGNNKFGDGNDRVLNKFYEMDQQFKTFMEKFNSSPIANNTVLIFTTDHATYVDDEYKKAFPNENRDYVSLDRIPYFIYYKGINPQIIDANGRNSLDMAPTILDFLDYSSKNYFLGTSLFSGSEEHNLLSSIYSEGTVLMKTSNNKISEIEENELKEIKEIVFDYFKVSQIKVPTN